jgi:F-type H+-transporting ATPase subunit a
MDPLNLGNLLPIAEAHAGEHEGPGYFGLIFYVAFLLLIMAIVIGLVRKGLGERVFKNPMTQAAEQMYLFIENMCVNIIGPHGRKYVPFIGTLWFVIFIGNTVALFFPTSPTADLSFNLAMAFIAVGYVQYEGVNGHYHHYRQRGADPFSSFFMALYRHVSHFTGPRLGLAMIPITLLIFVVEIISEVMKNVSLSLRLFGNMHGGHAAVEALNKVGEPIFFPIGGFLLIVKLLTVVVQALVFTLLTCVYISLVTHHEEEPSGGHGDLAPAH